MIIKTNKVAIAKYLYLLHHISWNFSLLSLPININQFIMAIMGGIYEFTIKRNLI